MRRKIALFLSMLMIMLAFTGCSQAEVGYLQMSKDMIKDMPVSAAEGSVDFAVNAEALKGFVMEVAKEAGADEATLAEMTEGLKEFTGKKTATLEYKSLSNLDTVSVEMELKLKYEGKSYDLGKIYLDVTEGYFISTKAVVGLYNLAKDVSGEGEFALVSNPEYEKALIAEILKTDYIQISMADMSGLSEEEAKEIYSGIKYDMLYDAVFDMYENALSGFSTNMITAINGGYEVKANGQQIADMLVELLGYTAENLDTVADALFDYVVVIIESMNMEEMEGVEITPEMYEEFMAEEAEGIKEGILEVQQVLKMALNQKGVSTALEAMSYKTSTVKDGKNYIAKETFSVDYKGQSAILVTSEGKTSPTAKKVVLPTTGKTPAQLTESIGAIEDQYNPVTGATISWGFSDDNDAWVFASREDVSFFGRDFADTTYQMVDNRVYLPLRAICDTLNEAVAWDQASKTASVVTEKGAVEVEGIIVDGRTFIKVRDFEKLGYTVDFESTDGFKEVYLSK